MSIEATGQLISKLHLSDSFPKKSEKKSPETCRTTDKVHRILCQRGLTPKKPCDNPKTPIEICRSNIETSSTDAKDLLVKPIITDESAFIEAFSWKETRQDHPNEEVQFRLVPDSKSILYHDDIPQFDENWNPFIFKTVNCAVQGYENTEPFYSDDNNNIDLEIYRDHAQILLDRFLKNHPAFKGSEKHLIHQTLMLQAIATAIKVDEEYGIYNSDFADCLNKSRSTSLTEDLHEMERLFLQGIDWNISRST